MLSIGKFAALTGLSIKSLRALDRRGLLRPAVVDARTGYRSYHPSQAVRAEWIALLKDCGLNPEETADSLAIVDGAGRDGEARLGEILQHYEADFRRRLKRIGETKRRLAAARSAQSSAGSDLPEVQVRYFAESRLCSSRRFGDYASIDPMITELRDFMRTQRLKESGPPMLLWGERVTIGDTPDIEVAIPYRGAADGVPQLYLRRLPGGEVASLVSARPRDALGADYERLFDWCFSHEYLIVGPIRAAFQADARLTELQVPVIRADRLPERPARPAS